MHCQPPRPKAPLALLLLPAGFTLALLLLLAGFTAGVMVDRLAWLPDSASRPPADLGHTFDPFWEVWNLVQENYVDRKAVDPEKMTRGAIDGMLRSLGDEGHTSYLTAEEYDQMEEDLEGKMVGIGVHMTLRNRQFVITGVIPNSPAQAAGLRPGDIFSQVEGKDVAELSMDRLSTLVRGKAGTEVHLKMLREGESRPLEFTITRARIEVPDVTWHLLPGVPIAHLAIKDFGEPAQALVQKAVRELREQGAKGLIVDLRGNPGGLKDQAVAVSSEFLKDGVVFIEQDMHGVQTPVPVNPGGSATDIPVVVLIDEGTASSAEIFAGALQDHERAKLVGTPTFGTGTVLQPFELKDGSAVLLAVAQWLTPKGREIWHKGIKPDFEVALPEDVALLLPEMEDDLDAAALARSEDKQLLKALEVLQEQLRQTK
jgi:carboxyl-terminal processing protease